LNIGLRLLNQLYRWKKLPLRTLSSMPQLQLLEQLGIARHRMVTRLIDFRNSIEHADKPPPDQKHCADLLEVVWYFLRSTDHLGLRIVSSFSFTQDPIAESSSGLSLYAQPEAGWILAFRAKLLRKYIRPTPDDKWLRVSVTWATEAVDYRPNPPSLTEAELHRLLEEAEHPIFFNGTIDGQQDHLQRIFKAYFALV
jgi:hypothetical protein